MRQSSEPFSRGFSDVRAPSLPRALALILGAAILVRALVFSALLAPEHALAPLDASALQGDPRLYHEWASELAAGRDPHAGGAWWHPPLYPLLLGRVYAVFGPDLRAAIAVQAVCGLLSLLFLHLWVRKLFGAGAALGAALLSVLYLPSCFFETRLLPDPLGALCAVVALWCAGAAAAARRPRAFLFAAGMAAGLSALARPQLLPFAGALVAWAAWLPPRQLSRATAAIAIALGAALPLASSLARNAAQGEAVLICANGGVNFWLANHAGATPYFRAPDRRWTRVEEQESQARETIAAERGEPASASAASRGFFAKGLAARLDAPLETLGLIARKTLAFLSNVEAGAFDLPQLERELAPRAWVAPLPFALLFALAVLGLFHLRREDALRLVPAVLLFATGAFAAAAIFTYSRLRLPVLPIAFASAGLALSRGLPRRAKTALACAGIAALAAWPDWEGLLELRRPKIYVEHALRRLRAEPPPASTELTRLDERLRSLGDAAHEGELVIATEVSIAERRGDAAAVASGLRKLSELLPSRDADALTDGLRLELARMATPGLEEALRGTGAAVAAPVYAVESERLIEALRRGAEADFARAALDLRFGYLLAESQPGVDPAAVLDRALQALHAALRYGPRDPGEALAITGPALYFRGGAYDEIAALPERRAQRDQLLELALNDYYRAVQVIHGDPPQRALDLLGPAFALGFLGRERAAHGFEERGRAATALADRVLAARQAQSPR